MQVETPKAPMKTTTKPVPANMFASLESYLGAMAPVMAERLSRSTSPLYDPVRDGMPDRLQRLAAQDLKPLPAQAAVVEAVIRGFSQSPVVTLCGEMGVGKGVMGPLVAGLLGEMRTIAGAQYDRPVRVVVTCPNHIVRKWQDHCLRWLPGWRVVMVQTFSQLDEIAQRKRPKNNEVWIIPRDRGKLSYSWRLGVMRKIERAERYLGEGGMRTKIRMVDVVNPQTGRSEPMEAAQETFSCPKCGQVVKAEQDGEFKEVELDYFARRGKLTQRRKCNHCNESLWQANNGRVEGEIGHMGIGIKRVDDPRLPRPGVSPRRCSPADYAQRKLRRNAFDLYIADELHELRGAASLQGGLFGTLAARSKRVLGMTGTLVGGYADNILYLLWRTMPKRLKADGLKYDEEGFKAFIKRYGVLRTEKKYTKDKPGTTTNDLVLGRGKPKGSIEKTMPGISPVLFARHLIGSAVFIRLQEMHEHLPTFHEKVHSVPLNKDQALCIAQMTEDFEDHRRRMRPEPVRCWSAARHVFMRWSDRPWPAHNVMERDEDGNEFKAFHVPALTPDQEFPKERRLRRLLCVEKKRGRKTWVFTEMTGTRWDVTLRLANYLEKYGLRVAVLRTEADGGPKPEDRAEWIEATAPGVDVVISNPNLVKTGLDLYDFPAIKFYMVGESTYTLRQAARRAWRLGQKERCTVDYLVYGSADAFIPKEKRALCTSIQSASLSLMSSKMAASLALEGDFSSQGLVALAGDGGDVASQLAKVICGTLTVEDPKVAFARYRAELEKAMPSLVRVEEPKPKPDPADAAAPGAEPGAAPVPAPAAATAPTVLVTPAPAAVPAPITPIVRPQTSVVGLSDAQLLDTVNALRNAQQALAATGSTAEAHKIDDTIARLGGELTRRKESAVQAVVSATGLALVERDGDRIRCGEHWIHVVTKARRTVRDRDFVLLNSKSPRGIIAFAEVDDGPIKGQQDQAARTVTVTFMRLADWMAGRRVERDWGAL